MGVLATLVLPTALVGRHGYLAGWHYALLSKWIVTDELRVDPFVVEILETRNPDSQGWGRIARIRRDRTTLFSQAGIYFEISGGTDLTGNGLPDVIITNESGGTGCYRTQSLIELDLQNDEFGITPLAVVNYCGGFEDVDSDGIVEFVAHDRSYAYRWTCGAYSPNPRVILAFKEGILVPAPELMRQQCPSDAELEKQLASFRNAADHWEGKFAALLEVVLDLIYSGNEQRAWEFLHEHWPGDTGQFDQHEFEDELQIALRGSPFWPAILAVNSSRVAMSTASLADQ